MWTKRFLQLRIRWWRLGLVTLATALHYLQHQGNVGVQTTSVEQRWVRLFNVGMRLCPHSCVYEMGLSVCWMNLVT